METLIVAIVILVVLGLLALIVNVAGRPPSEENRWGTEKPGRRRQYSDISGGGY